MIKILTKCPVCESGLKAIKLKCESCGTVIENNFDFPGLLRLNREQLEFATVFLLCRGNIKDVEKELGISYPTVRAKLDQIIDELSDIDTFSAKKSPMTFDILNKIESGEISPEDAIKLLSKK
jgi:hypothetical protein